MIVYHQKIKDGDKKIFIGEDAYPFCQPNLLLVADGLGGRGGYPHTKIDHDILEEEKLFDVMFKHVFPAEVDEEFLAHVHKSFSEVFQTKDYYFSSDQTTRSSGYFASRIASIIVLYELKYNQEFAIDGIFADVMSKDGEEREQALQAYGDKLASILKEKMAKIAEKVGFQVETSLSGAYLLPSTLTVALVKEDKENSAVDVLYLWAGDSRGYMWNKHGLHQITDDHEAGETMTNLITLSRPDFKIETRHLRFQTPCALFNATDGCYKCPRYSSPLEMEMTILTAFHESDSFEQVAERLCEQYSVIGRHDDSNTMAFELYGYQGFEDFKVAVEKRLADINEQIVGKMEDILTKDYTAEQQRLEAELEDIIYADCFGWSAIPEVQSIICKMMSENSYAPYVAELQKTGATQEELEAKAMAFKEELVAWIKANYTKVRIDREGTLDYLEEPELFHGLLTSELDYTTVFLPTSHVEASAMLNDWHERYTAFKEASKGQSQLIKEIQGRFVQRYWRVNRDTIAHEVWTKHRHVLGEERVANIEAQLKQYLAENQEVLKKIELRSKIYKEYDKEYNKYFRGTKL